MVSSISAVLVRVRRGEVWLRLAGAATGASWWGMRSSGIIRGRLVAGGDERGWPSLAQSLLLISTLLLISNNTVQGDQMQNNVAGGHLYSLWVQLL